MKTLLQMSTSWHLGILLYPSGQLDALFSLATSSHLFFFFSIFQFRILTSYFMVEVKAIILKCCCLSLTNSVTLLVSASIFSSTTEQVSSSSERPVSLYVPAFFYLSKAMPLLYCTSLTAPFIGLIGLISSTHKLGTRSPISNTLQTRKATLMSPYPAGAPSCSPYSSGQLQTSCLSPLPFTVTLSHFAPVPTLFWFLPSPLQDSSSQCPRWPLCPHPAPICCWGGAPLSWPPEVTVIKVSLFVASSFSGVLY